MAFAERHAQNMAVHTPVRTTYVKKAAKKHAYSSYSGHKTVATLLFFTKVDTLAQAGTCGSCFR